jgi:3-deoxy-manno-octulosonate cytidylyltransferase (CMP-KDO synthetase)
VEHHGANPANKIIAIIPARLESTRLPGKLLLEIAGRPLILRTAERVREAGRVDETIVATDSAEITEVVERAGFTAVLTSREHATGSDRIAEAARSFPDAGIVINVQGDEPLISPATIDRAVDAMLADERADIVTTFEAIADPRDVLSPDSVKVVLSGTGDALYFSRSPIPYPRDAIRRHGSIETALRQIPELVGSFRKHTGLYVFRRDALFRFTSLAAAPLESAEMLEQLRALENGMRIRLVESAEASHGVDTQEDLERVRLFFEAGN